MLESISRILAVHTGFLFVIMQKIRPSEMYTWYTNQQYNWEINFYSTPKLQNQC